MEIIKLNLIPSGVNPVCHCSQYDNGRVIRCELFNGLTPYTLASGDTVTLNARKPDNTIITASVTATQGNNYVDITTTEQLCAVVGETLCKLKITNGSTEIGTLIFYMQIERDVLADGIPSQSVIDDLDSQITAIADTVINDRLSDFNDNLALNICNVLEDEKKTTQISGGVTYTYNNDGTYTVTGTQSGTTFLNLTDPNSFPKNLKKGETYFVNYAPTGNGTVYFEIWSDQGRINYLDGAYYFTVPNNVTKLWFRLATWNANDINVTLAVPIVSTLKTFLNDTIVFPKSFYRETSSGTTLNYALTLANVELLAETYEITRTISIPSGKKLKGKGINQTILNFNVTSGNAILCETGNEQIEGLTLNGGLTSRPSTYSVTNIKNGIVIQTETNKPTYIDNVAVIGFSKNGILVQNRGYSSLCSIIANNLYLQYNGCGICFYEKGEYGVLTNCIAIDNYFGCIDSGGNNKISNCGFDRNTKGLYSSAVNNDTHSDIISCSFNHCTDRAVEIDGIASMLSFTACQFFGATNNELVIYNAQAVSLVNCLFGLNAKLAFNKASKSNNLYILNNCLFGNTPNTISIQSGTLVVLNNCYTQTGSTVTV